MDYSMPTIVYKTGFTPYYLIFGQPPRLPIELIVPTPTKIPISRSDYVKTWNKQMKEAYRLALQQSDDKKAKLASKNNTKIPCLI